jgi:hypothetical protein
MTGVVAAATMGTVAARQPATSQVLQDLRDGLDN